MRKIYEVDPTPKPLCDQALDAKKKAEEQIISLLFETSLHIERLKIDLGKVNKESKFLGELSRLFLKAGRIECKSDEVAEALKINEKLMKDDGTLCQFAPAVWCPILYAENVVLSTKQAATVPCLKRLQEEYDFQFQEKFKKIRNLQQKLGNAIDSGDDFTKKNKEEIDEIQAELDDINKYIQDNCSKKYKDFIEKISNLKSAKCNKSKEKIKKLKNQYFKLSKDILDIQYGIAGIKLNKLQQRNLKELKPMIEEAIKKIEDVKRYVIETDDEKAFFAIYSEIKVFLAENIKKQTVIEANLKNLLIKKEKTNNILKRTKKLLDLKIKQSIKLCN
jgi:hypothetical protein